jgi:predicted dithiol-disulfide oxidoreductase (DUF899 family)
MRRPVKTITTSHDRKKWKFYITDSTPGIFNMDIFEQLQKQNKQSAAKVEELVTAFERLTPEQIEDIRQRMLKILEQ